MVCTDTYECDDHRALPDRRLDDPRSGIQCGLVGVAHLGHEFSPRVAPEEGKVTLVATQGTTIELEHAYDHSLLA